MCTALYRSRAGVPLLLRAAPLHAVLCGVRRIETCDPFRLSCVAYNGQSMDHTEDTSQTVSQPVLGGVDLAAGTGLCNLSFSFLLFGESMKNHISFSIFSLEARRLAGRHYAKASVSRF